MSNSLNLGKHRAWIGKSACIFGTFFFLLLLSQGFPVTCDDWFVAPRSGKSDLVNTLYRGYTWAEATALSINGRHIGNFLLGFLISWEWLRRIFISATITCMITLICKLCHVRSGKGYLVTATLAIALPAPLFAQTYAWCAGFSNYVPPALCVLGYLLLVFSLFSKERCSSWLLPAMFLLGLATQLFVENITVAMCIVSAGFCVVYGLQKRRCSWTLLAHLIGTIVGGVLMFISVGYRTIGTEVDTYRSIGSGFLDILLLCGKNFITITDQLTGDNWLLILPLSGLCAFLLLRERPKFCKSALCCILLPTLYFVINGFLLKPLTENNDMVLYLTCGLSLVLNLAYLAGVLWSIWFCVKDRKCRDKILLLFGLMVLFAAPLLIVSPVSERCLFVPFILLLCAVLLLLGYCRPLFGKVSCGIKVLPVLGCIVLLCCYQWTMYRNGQTEEYRVERARELMSQGATVIELPGYPYEEFVFGEDSIAIQYHYYYETVGDIEFRLVAYDEWDFTK